jgi:SH3 domain-containing YSC84-like protein 1
MKRIALSLMLLALVPSAFALDKAELDRRIVTLTSLLMEMQQKPDKSIPADALARAKGIILLRRAKGGLVFGYQHGEGVAMVRDDGGAWSSPAFMSDNEGSFGFQVGGETSFFVVLLMNTNSLNLLTDGRVQFAGEARGTAGDASGGQEGKMTDVPPILVYSDRTGLYGGAVIKGGAVAPNPEADQIYYGQAMTTRDILFEGKVKPSDTAILLAKKLVEYSRNPKQ